MPGLASARQPAASRPEHAEAVLVEPNDRFLFDLRQAERAARQEAASLWGACR